MRKLVVLGLLVACGKTNAPVAADAARTFPVQLGMYQVTAGSKGNCLGPDLGTEAVGLYLRLEPMSGGIVRHWCTSSDEPTCDTFEDRFVESDALGYDPTLQVNGGSAMGDRVSSMVDVYEAGPMAGQPYQCDLTYDAETIMGTTATTITSHQHGTFSMKPYQTNVPCTDDAALALGNSVCSDMNEAIYVASYVGP